jgi:hypothetical protein
MEETPAAGVTRILWKLFSVPKGTNSADPLVSIAGTEMSCRARVVEPACTGQQDHALRRAAHRVETAQKGSVKLEDAGLAGGAACAT